MVKITIAMYIKIWYIKCERKLNVKFPFYIKETSALVADVFFYREII